MDVKIYIKKIGASVYDFTRKIRSKLHYWRIETKAGISLDGYPTIASSARVDIVFGGSISIGHGSEILDGALILTYGGNIKIGNNCSINPYTIIYGHGNTTIGNNVLIAGSCMIIPSNHNFKSCDVNINAQGHTSNGIVIEDNVWIGHGCSILDNVHIGQGSVVAAGSVVSKSVPSFTIVAGVPAKFVKSRN
jgi:acetyltransferase-like isoleucine patch superfamily enzyme